ncbi:MAG: DUF3606 domain-containing protein [Rhizobiales bacterium]|nr:DUF3606 domain-containing protein [Hyphomicrobiales bacterium]OJY40805.1 MAG: hypothetical protein BGP08_12870 [Rhizobiales bacterium 64-17]
MADNKRKRGGADKRLISLSEAYEVHYWSRKFKVTPAKLRAAVKRVGHSAKAVEAYLAELAHKARDRALISLSQAYEVRYWTKKFNVTPTVLSAAVQAVGHSSKAVAAYLGIGGAAKRKVKRKTKRKAKKTAAKRKGTARRRAASRTVRKMAKKSARKTRAARR